jgi:hypothetical protein
MRVDYRTIRVSLKVPYGRLGVARAEGSGLVGAVWAPVDESDRFYSF